MFNKKSIGFIFTTLLTTGIYTSAKILSFEENKQALNNHCFTENKNLNASIAFTVDKDDIVYTVSFDSGNLKNSNVIYSYVYNRTNPDVMKISYSSDSEKIEEFKKVKDIFSDLDKVLDSLKVITFSDLKVNMTLTRNLDGSILGKINNINKESNINTKDVQDGLQKSLLKILPNNLDNLVFAIYLNTLAMSLVQHESLKTISN